jgi:hypothetical protein
MKDCENLLSISRKHFMKTTIKFLVGKTRTEKNEYINIVSDLVITEEATNVNNYSGKAF